MTDFIYSLGDIFETIFIYTIEPLGNIPNYIFIGVGFAALGYWMVTMKNYAKKAREEGGII